MFTLLVVSILELAFSSLVLSKVHYVRSSDSVSSSCPGHGSPCLTLQQYADMGNLTSGTTFEILPGIHSITSSLVLVNISNIVLRSPKEVGLPAEILCSCTTAILCDNVTNLLVERLTFSQNHTNTLVLKNCSKPTAFRMMNCNSVRIDQIKFQGNGNVSISAMVVIAITSAYSALGGFNLTVQGSLFSGNEGYDDGGAVSATFV